MQDLLIALQSETLSQALSDTFPGYHVHICHTGTEALRQIDSLRPEVLIIGLSLPVIDGLSVLQTAAYKPPVIIGLTNFVSPSVIRKALDLGVQRISLIPCKTSHIADLLNDILQKEVPSLGV